jgi:hypothetical protein
MTEKEYILKLMYAAFLDIRGASHSGDSHTCFVLAAIFHNVPLQINRAGKGETSYTDIIAYIQKKCEQRKCQFWLDNANANQATSSRYETYEE